MTTVTQTPSERHGVSLSEYLQRGHLPIDEVLSYLFQIADLLRHVHEKDDAVGGLSLSTILITGDGEVIVEKMPTSFEEIATGDAAVEGRVGRELALSDLVAWGHIAYALVAGAHPSRHSDSMSEWDKDRIAETLKFHAPDAPHVLIQMISRAMSGVSAERYHSAQEILHDLDIVQVAVTSHRGAARVVSLDRNIPVKKIGKKRKATETIAYLLSVSILLGIVMLLYVEVAPKP